VKEVQPFTSAAGVTHARTQGVRPGIDEAEGGAADPVLAALPDDWALTATMAAAATMMYLVNIFERLCS